MIKKNTGVFRYCFYTTEKMTGIGFLVTYDWSMFMDAKELLFQGRLLWFGFWISFTPR